MHGGDIYRNKIEYDFSVNVNPLGMPQKMRDALIDSVDLLEKYPDYRCERLKEKIADRYGISAENIVCGNGASEIISAICREHGKCKTLIVSPSFTGYEYGVKSAGGEILYFSLEESDDYELKSSEKLIDCIMNNKPGLLILGNPNNPTGRLTDKKILVELAIACGKAGTVLAIDECFVELTEGGIENSFISEIHECPNVIIVNAFTKSYAIPGVRLGFAICGNVDFAKSIQGQLPEWNVSTLAQVAGLCACREEEFVKESSRTIALEREWLSQKLVELGMRVYPSKANFILFRDQSGDNLYEDMKKRGILIRHCDDYEGLNKEYYRIAVKNPRENEIFIQNFAEIRRNKESK